MTKILITLFDFFLALFGLIIASPILILVTLINSTGEGSPILIQERIGKSKKSFNLIKFRTMPIDTKPVASHLANPTSITRFGLFLRRSKIDELPQLINVLKGEMSLVGPRPSLPTQHELISERSYYNVYSVRPGITGLAQVNGIDMSTPKLLAKTDGIMIQSMSIRSYLKYIFITIAGSGRGDAMK